MTSKQKKIVFNLKDVNTDPFFIDNVPREIMIYEKTNKVVSLGMVVNALSMVKRNNFFVEKGIREKFDAHWPRLDKCI
jgi:hypothetical protein